MHPSTKLAGFSVRAGGKSNVKKALIGSELLLLGRVYSVELL